MSNRAKIREEAKKLNPIDDVMFRKMAESIDFCQENLQVILDDPDLIVKESIPQWTGENLQGRSVILDAKCVLGNGTHTDIEVQKADNDDHQRRVRYNGAILTTNVTDPGSDFKKVPNVCVVYISQFDVFKENRALYHVDRVLRETGHTVDNGYQEIYVNAIVKDGSAVSELMEVFTKDDAYNPKFPETSSLKKHYKETERGIEIMSDIVEKIREEGRAEGLAEGRVEGSQDAFFVLNKLQNSGRTEDIQKALNDKNYLDRLIQQFCGK